MATDSVPSSVTIVFAKDGATLRGGESIRRNAVTGQLLPAIPIGKDPDFLWDKIGGEINGAALATIDERDDAISDLTAKLKTAEDAAKTAQADASAQAAQIESLTVQLDALRNPPVDPHAVPSLNRAQLRKMLAALGVDETEVEATIDAIPDAKARQDARIDWEDAPAYHHDHPLVRQIGGVLGQSQDQIDAAFRQAALL